MNNKELMRLFRFTESDLQHNQGGALSPGQQRRVAQSRRTMIAVMLLIVATCAAWIFSFARQLIAKELNPTQTGVYWLGIVALVILAAGVLVAALRSSNQAVVKVHGPVQLVQYKNSNGSGITYEMWVGSERFEVTRDAFASLQDDLDVTVYYLQGEHRVLSVNVKEPEAVH